MKITVWGVPEGLSNTSESFSPREGENAVPNPLPEMELSPVSGGMVAHSALVEFASSGNWEALYDPTNESSLIFEGGEIIGVRDSLGKQPPLMVDDYTPNPVRDTLGSVGTVSGLYYSSEFQVPDPTVVGVFPTYSARTSFYLFRGQVTSAPPFDGVLWSDHENDLAFWREGESVSFGNSWPKGGVILSSDFSNGHLHSGFNQLFPEDSSPNPIAAPGEGFSVGGLGSASEPGGFGPLLIASGTIPPDLREEAVRLLSRLSGVPVGDPRAQHGATGWVTLDEDGTQIAGFNPDRPEQLASVTKLWTTYLAYGYFKQSGQSLSDLIPVSEQYVPEETTRTPVVYPGDKISWETAFHASLMVSHNQITDTLAAAAIRTVSPGLSDQQAIDQFVDVMNSRAKAAPFGWREAVFTTPQGRYDSILSSAHVAELMFKMDEETPLIDILGTQFYDYEVIGPNNTVRLSGTLSNFISDNYAGDLFFPERIAGKGGDSPAPARRAMAMLWDNPETQRKAATVVLSGLGETTSGKYFSLREKMDASYSIYNPPFGWGAGPGTRVSWQIPSSVVLSADRASYSGTLQVTPISPSYGPRPTLRKGDISKIRLKVSGTPGMRVEVKVSILGGGFATADGTLTSVFTLSSSTRIVNTSAIPVRDGGAVSFSITASGGGQNPTLRLSEGFLDIGSEGYSLFGYQMETSSFTVNESNQSLDSNDSSGSVGDFRVTSVIPEFDSVVGSYGFGFLRNRAVTLETPFGALRGQTTEVIKTDESTLALSGVSELSILNAYNVSAPPYSGPLVGLIETYLNLLAGEVPIFSIDESLLSRTVVVPGWHGELWYHLKLLCAAEEIQLTLNPDGGIHVSPAVSRFLAPVEVSQVTEGYSQGSLSQAVEVYRYGNKWVDQEKVYPLFPDAQPPAVFSVVAGEEAIHTIQLSASLESFIPPVMQNSPVSAHSETNSVYNIVGDDGFLVRRAQWEAQGGRVSFKLLEDSRTIELTMVGPTGIYNGLGEEIRTFDMAVASDTSGSRYPALHIRGTGVIFNRQLMRFPTGVEPGLSGSEVGATIDNPFLSTLSQVAAAGALAAFKQSGSTPTISYSSSEPHGGSWGSGVMGGLLSVGAINYRIRDASYSENGVNISGEYHLTYGDFEFDGTYDQFDTENSGLTYQDVQGRGNKYV